MRKRDRQRAFAPDLVSAETLAYRLDCAEATIYDYVKRGILPKPRQIGGLSRWLWSEVEEHLGLFGADDEQPELSPEEQLDSAKERARRYAAQRTADGRKGKKA